MNQGWVQGRTAPRTSSAAPISVTSDPLQALESLNLDLLSLHQDLPFGWTRAEKERSYLLSSKNARQGLSSTMIYPQGIPSRRLECLGGLGFQIAQIGK